ncbi:MAG: DUF4013 domain-containing protein [Candidatus Obscuribacterales bacterium]|nr:DUF4013 domain-containing protein [Candidatus Obscuribacterales bacterium]
MNINESLRLLFSDENRMFKTGMGGIFIASSIVVLLYTLASIPFVAACHAVNTGYNLRLMRQQTVPSETKLPEWNEWGDLFISGLTWIALQTCVWLLGMFACVAFMLFCSAQAYVQATLWISSIWLSCGVLASILLILSLSFISSFLMVHFAQEENTRAGLAYIYVIHKLARKPRHYLSIYLVSLGIQIASLLLPILSIIGIFLIPTSIFAGQLASSTLLAKAWALDSSKD